MWETWKSTYAHIKILFLSLKPFIWSTCLSTLNNSSIKCEWTTLVHYFVKLDQMNNFHEPKWFVSWDHEVLCMFQVCMFHAYDILVQELFFSKLPIVIRRFWICQQFLLYSQQPSPSPATCWESSWPIYCLSGLGVLPRWGQFINPIQALILFTRHVWLTLAHC